MKRLLLLGLALGAIVQSRAHADECQLTLSQSRLDFGVMNRAVQRNPGAEILLGERRLSLNLNCPTPTDMHVFYRALAATAERYRFTERGSYRVHISDAVLDGQAVELGLTSG
ncbi:hypothetical protein HX846_38175, partial [Pseudomonas sp. K5002]|nr:hypothetical protein [Pseudomonas sp. K5002]